MPMTARLAGRRRQGPTSAKIAVRIKTPDAKIGDYRPVCCLVVANTGQNEFEQCLVEITQFSGVVPEGMPIPLKLRADSQIRNKERGSFPLLAGQEPVIPLAFHSPHRANEWFLFDENGQSYFIPANPIKLLLRIYGGAAPGCVLAFINTDAGWNAMPSVETVPTDFVLNTADGGAIAIAEPSPHDLFAPELTRIFTRQIAVLGRITPNFISASTKQPLPGDTWASLKPWRPVLYPDSPKFRELPSADAQLLVEFYDSLQGISDVIDSYIDKWQTTDVNAWNGLMHQVQNSLNIGERAIRRFCPDGPFYPGTPAAGTFLTHAERAIAGAQAALKAHLARHSVS
jgi:hypothetical protein